MFLDKSSLTESGYIAEDLLDGKLEDLSRKCFVIRQTIHDGDFTLEEALKLYQVSEDDYKKFLAKNFIAELRASFDPVSKKLNMIYSIEVFAEVYDLMLSAFDIESISILKHFKTLSKAIKEDKVKV
jgi:hypothetical protein